MSIIIKDLDLPKGCTTCPLHWEVEGFGSRVVACVPTKHGLGDVTEESLINSRNRGYCPLSDLGQHGDLIDRDALLRIWAKEKKDLHSKGIEYCDDSWDGVFAGFEHDVQHIAPVIIPAERGEE